MGEVSIELRNKLGHYGACICGTADIGFTLPYLPRYKNGLCRATGESLAGAEVTRLATPDGVGAALGVLCYWRPAASVTVALAYWAGAFLACGAF